MNDSLFSAIFFFQILLLMMLLLSIPSVARPSSANSNMKMKTKKAAEKRKIIFFLRNVFSWKHIETEADSMQMNKSKRKRIFFPLICCSFQQKFINFHHSEFTFARIALLNDFVLLFCVCHIQRKNRYQA